ncbi:MAG: tetratricopeptide repeat protein [Thermodesulfobacteriota bacterium]
MSCFRRVLILLQVVLLLSLPSCGGLKRTQVKNAIEEAHRSLKAGDFQKALDTYQSMYKKYPKDPETRKNYIEAIESVKAHGDKAFDTDNFVQAQITYELLLKNFPRFSDFSNLLSFKEQFLITRVKNCLTHQAEKQAQCFLRTRDFQGGIDVYRSLIEQYPSDKTVRNRYVSLLESIKRRADLEFERKGYASSGRSYRILFKNYPSLNHLKRSLSYNAGSLEARINACRKILFEDALEQYRSGDLTQAISTWKNILTFDPENLEVKKAIDKAVFQSKNLKKIKSDNNK